MHKRDESLIPLQWNRKQTKWKDKKQFLRILYSLNQFTQLKRKIFIDTGTPFTTKSINRSKRCAKIPMSQTYLSAQLTVIVSITFWQKRVLQAAILIAISTNNKAVLIPLLKWSSNWSLLWFRECAPRNQPQAHPPIVVRPEQIETKPTTNRDRANNK